MYESMFGHSLWRQLITIIKLSQVVKYIAIEATISTSYSFYKRKIHKSIASYIASYIDSYIDSYIASSLSLPVLEAFFVNVHGYTVAKYVFKIYKNSFASAV